MGETRHTRTYVPVEVPHAGPQAPRAVRKGAQGAAMVQKGDPAHEAAAAALAGLSLAHGAAASGGAHAPPLPAAGAAVSPAEALKAAQAALSGIASQRPAPAHQSAAAAAAAGPQHQPLLPPAPQHLPSPQRFAPPGQVPNLATRTLPLPVPTPRTEHLGTPAAEKPQCMPACIQRLQRSGNYRESSAC